MIAQKPVSHKDNSPGFTGLSSRGIVPEVPQHSDRSGPERGRERVTHARVFPPAFAGSTIKRSVQMTKRYTVYTIVKRDRKDDFWLNIGVAFPHDDGKGFNVFLQALPLGDGKIVLRE